MMQKAIRASSISKPARHAVPALMDPLQPLIQRASLYASHNTALLNYRKNKVNIYTRLNYINASGTVDWTQDYRFLDKADNIIGSSWMHSIPVEVFEKNNERLGMDYFQSDNTFMGISFSGAYYGNTMHSPINMTDKQNGSTTTTLRNTYESSLRRNGGMNAYLKHTFSKRSELNVNLDYLLYTRIMDQYLTTEANKDGVLLPDQLTLRSKLPYNVQVYSARADHSYAFSNGLKLETGAKYSRVINDNDTWFSVLSNGNWIFDSRRTNHFVYKEQIGALYINTVKKLGDKWEAQLGLRGEYADIYGIQLANGQEVKRKLPALFPTAYVVYKPDSLNSLEANYGRRVERPEYRSLNPFNYYTFYNTYQRGNPYLLPQYTNNLKLKHTFKNTWTTSLQLSEITNVIRTINGTDAASLTTYGLPVNLSSSRFSNLSCTYNGNPVPWWNMTASVSGRYVMHYDAALQATKEGTGYAAQWYNEFTLGKWTMDCYAAYNSDGISSPVAADLWNLYTNMSISRKLLKDNLTLRLITNDPFFIYKNSYSIFQPNLVGTSTLRMNSRDITLVATFTFGTKNNRNTPQREKAPEEANRVGM
jgi:iron complex outermembrane receptor protein